MLSARHVDPVVTTFEMIFFCHYSNKGSFLSSDKKFGFSKRLRVNAKNYFLKNHDLAAASLLFLTWLINVLPYYLYHLHNYINVSDCDMWVSLMYFSINYTLHREGGVQR